VLATDSRYEQTARTACADCELLVDREVVGQLGRLAARRGALRVAYESHRLTVEAFLELRDVLDGTAPVELVRGGRLVERLRERKDPGEVAAVRAACAAADAALSDVLALLRPGLTERAIADELEARMRRHGAQALGFDSIVAGGPNSAVPHHSPTDRPVAPGELLKLDFGAMVDGYRSDMTRTVVLGEPVDWKREIYELVEAAQQAAVEAVAPGVATTDVDLAARRVIESAGLGDAFVHGVGHGVGLDIHEAPALDAASTDVLQAGMVVTAEPGVYLAGRGGVRIEDTLLVTGDGAERLTLAPRTLLAL
jgi:Xaa-Pro aminopeptidase